jgi:hypothetical protein
MQQRALDQEPDSAVPARESRESRRERALLRTRIFRRGEAIATGLAIEVSRGGISLSCDHVLLAGSICQLCVEIEPGREFSIFAKVVSSVGTRVGFLFDPSDPQTAESLYETWIERSRLNDDDGSTDAPHSIKSLRRAA